MSTGASTNDASTGDASVRGPDFLALQVQDLESAARFYEEVLGLTPTDEGPPHAVVFATRPIPFALRTPLPGTDLGAGPAGNGVALWLLADDSPALLKALQERGVEIASGLSESPFGQTFTFRDPEGYLITIHDQA